MRASSSIGMLALIALAAFGCGPVTEEETRVPVRAWSPDAPPAEPRVLGEGWLSTVHSERDEFNAWISPDETILLFSSFGREDGLGGGDLYVSTRGDDGEWREARNLGAPVNSPALDYCPFIAPDGKAFIFSSRRSRIVFPPTEPHDYRELIRLLSGVENGNGDLFWMKAPDWESDGS